MLCGMISVELWEVWEFHEVKEYLQRLVLTKDTINAHGMTEWASGCV